MAQKEVLMIILTAGITLAGCTSADDREPAGSERSPEYKAADICAGEVTDNSQGLPGTIKQSSIFSVDGIVSIPAKRPIHF